MDHGHARQSLTMSVSHILSLDVEMVSSMQEMEKYVMQV